MKNKSKLGLSLLTGLTTLSVATPLATSCAKTNKYIEHVHETEEDKLYGINANTYENIKDDYINKFQNQLIERGFDEGSEEWKYEMNNLNYSLNIFDNFSKTVNMSYGDLTSSLMTYAKRTNGLTLRRTTNAKPSDVDDMYQGARNSFDLYMDQQGFSSSLKDTVFKDADSKFATLKTQLQSKGTMENDPYGALQEAKSSLLSFFDLINAEISRYASMMVITNFKKLYNLSLKKEALEYIENNLTVGGQIDEASINQIFDVIDVENGTTATFRNDIMTGYVLTPTLTAVKINNKTNEHEIDITWSCISNTYINSNDAETINAATAYEYDVPEHDKLDRFLTSKSTDINDFFKILNVKSTPGYSNFGVQKEKENLRKTYFDPNIEESIVFKMPDASDKHAKLDPFYMSEHGIYTDDKGVHDGQLSTETLAETGIMISDDAGKTFKYLSDVIKSIGDSKDFDWENATLAQQFVLGADVYAKVREIDKNTHTISLELWAKYKNSTYAKDQIDSGSWEPVCNTWCTGYPISEEKFQEFSKDFSMSYNHANIYRNANIETSKKLLAGLVAASSVLEAVNTALIVGHSIALVKTLNQPADFTLNKPAIILGLVTASMAFAMNAYTLVIYGMRLDEAIKFSDAIKSFNNNPLVKEAYAKLDEASKIFVLYNSNDGYKTIKETEVSYRTKYDAFKGASIEEMMSWDKYFKTAFAPDSDFEKLAKSMPVDISKEGYVQISKDLDPFGDTWMKVATILGGCSIMVTLFSAVLYFIFSKSIDVRIQCEQEIANITRLANEARITLTEQYGYMALFDWLMIVLAKEWSTAVMTIQAIYLKKAKYERLALVWQGRLEDAKIQLLEGTNHKFSYISVISEECPEYWAAVSEYI